MLRRSPWLPAHLGPWCVVLMLSGSWVGDAARSKTQGSDDGVWRQRPIYPFSPTNEVTDAYHGFLVADPYRWLEGDQNPAVQAWVSAQNRVTSELLDTMPGRKWLTDRLRQLERVEYYALPVRRGGRFFFTRGERMRAATLCWGTSLESEAGVLVGPGELRPLGVDELAGYVVSPDGRRVAYGVADRQHPGQTWRVRGVADDREWPDTVSGVQFADVVWTADSAGFYYCRFVEPATNAVPGNGDRGPQLLLHRLGEDPSLDALVYASPDQPTWSYHPRLSEDGRYLVLHIVAGTDPSNRVHYQDLHQADSKMVELVPESKARYVFLGNAGERLFFQTDAGASRGRIVAVDTGRPAPVTWEEIVPETTDTLESTGWVGGRLFLRYLHHAVSRVVSVDRNGGDPKDVLLPGLGSVSGFGGLEADTETFYLWSSFATPPTLYRYDLSSGTSTIAKSPPLDFDPGQYVTRQVFVRSADGTQVPMFLAQRADLVPDERGSPTLLYGYGGFGVSLKPSYSPGQLVWMDLGGVYAVPNLRGGGEYGEAWHQAGTRQNRPRVTEDFIAAAQWLILNDVTSSRRLAALGTANGGLLVGTCLTQRPGLFAAAVVSSGVFDLLRFPQFTIGWAWRSEYGDPDDPGDYELLRAASPLHNVQAGTVYPSLLVTTAGYDDRIVPAHSYKFIAALQAAHAGNNPILLRVEPPPGGDRRTASALQQTVEAWLFLAHELQMPIPPVGKPRIKP